MASSSQRAFAMCALWRPRLGCCTEALYGVQFEAHCALRSQLWCIGWCVDWLPVACLKLIRDACGGSGYMVSTLDIWYPLLAPVLLSTVLVCLGTTLRLVSRLRDAAGCAFCSCAGAAVPRFVCRVRQKSSGWNALVVFSCGRLCMCVSGCMRRQSQNLPQQQITCIVFAARFWG
jgi:hypothetical protein